jgi:hypothetical protein
MIGLVAKSEKTDKTEAAEWTLTAGEDVFWFYGEKGIIVKVKTIPKDPNEKVTVEGPNGRDVLVPRTKLKKTPSEEELAYLAATAT